MGPSCRRPIFGTSTVALRRDSVVWSDVLRPRFIKRIREAQVHQTNQGSNEALSLPQCRWNTVRRVNAVTMARSE